MTAEASLKILVVEDDGDTQANLRDLLELDGHQICAVGSLQEAIQRTREQDFDAILLDRRLPDGTAETALSELKRQAPRAALMIVTAFADLQSVIAALRGGADEYLLKPIDADVLRASLARVARQKRTDEALRISEEQFRSAFENAPVGMALASPEGRWLRCNSTLTSMLGYTPEQLVGSPWLAVVHPEDQSAAAALLQSLGQSQSKAGWAEIRYVHADGSPVWTLTSMALVRDAAGQPLHLLLQAQNTTELREAQQAAMQAERLAAIGQMVAGLAHESRNALQRSQACLELLELELADRPQARELVARIQRAQEHLHHLYEEVRNYAAPIQLQRSNRALDRLWRESWSDVLAAKAAQGNAAVLREERETSDLHCQVDALAMEQVFRNIFENALAAAGNGATVTVRASEDRLAGRPAVRLSIRDNGPGFTPEQQRRIFEPFFTTKSQGTGLGMAIAKRIVEAHGGRISAQQAPGGGAEIVIVLPKSLP
jgi:hypothetical protein